MESSEGILYIIVGLGLLCASLLALLFLRRRTDRLPRPGSFGENSEEMEERLHKLLADIQDLSRDQIAKLDTKIRVLTQLLSECDRKKEELQGLLGADGPPTPAPAPVAARPANPLRDQVYSLQDEGRQLDDICGETGLEKGEVELILGLRRIPAAGS